MPAINVVLGAVLLFFGRSLYWLFVAIAGLIGAVLAAVLMDWAVIVLSSLVGAGAVVTSFGFSPAVSAAVFIVLAAVGMAVQGKRLEPRIAGEPHNS